MGHKKQIDTSMYFGLHTECPIRATWDPITRLCVLAVAEKANTQRLRECLSNMQEATRHAHFLDE